MLKWTVRIAAVPAVALSLVLATSTIVSAQQTGTITGSVIDSQGQSLQGVQLHIPEVQLGTLTNAQGRYVLLNVPAGEYTVRAQMLGYAAQEQVVTVADGASVVADFQMAEEAINVEGIVVTALGIERAERSLGFAVQQIDQAQLEAVPQMNLTAALQGKVAGVQVTQTSSRPGAANRVVIRGESSFTGGGRPLYVIDGVPVTMDTDVQGTFGPESGEAGSRSMDIDMNNVESMSVLRGAAATALYGSRAAQGAILIKTKGGTPGTPIRFTMNTRYERQNAILEGIQETYTAGRGGFYCNGKPENYGGWCEQGYYDLGYNSPTTNRAWGPHRDSLSAAVMAHECPGETDPSKCIRMRDPRKDFYNTGIIAETSLNATGGLPNGGSFNLGGAYVNHGGITPSTSLERLNLNANMTLQLTDRLRSNTTVMYANTNNVWLTEGWLSIDRTLQYLTPNRDIRDAWEEDGSPVMWGSNSPHPEWIAKNEERTGVTGRWIASQYLEFDILDNLTVSNRLGYDTYLDTRLYNQNERPWLTSDGRNSGSTRQERFTRSQLNNDLMLTRRDLPDGGHQCERPGRLQHAAARE